MFRTLSRLFLPNPLDRMIAKLAKRGGKKILLGWNRGLGDIALGLYAIVLRIREKIPDAEITFLTRENLREGFSLLENVDILIARDWKRGENRSVQETLRGLKIDPHSFDLIIEKPSPTDWVFWQRGKIVPKLQWDRVHDSDFEKFQLSEEFIYIAVQVVAETNYGLWRNWPLERWNELFSRLEMFPNVKVLLFGFGNEPSFSQKNIIDLRGKTTLFELLSIVKHRCKAALLPDSGILSMIYYLNEQFPFELISLWGDPNHGILKQNVASPNAKLIHHPLIGSLRDLSSVSVSQVMNLLFPLKPLVICPKEPKVLLNSSCKVGAIILAGGQGSRLGISGPKGTFLLGKKSLFQRICEKAPEKGFPIAIMTSPLNHQETLRFFEEHDHFDREVYFFQQSVLPFLDEKKKSLQMKGPDGNGSVFKAFEDSGLLSSFINWGIDAITILPVDNPLAHPNDLDLVAHHMATQSDVTIKCVERLRPLESMGALVEREGRIEITEYLDLDPGVSYVYGNTGIMVMSPSFLSKMAMIELPIHYVRKYFEGRAIFKGEKFIFDALPYASKVEALCSCRESCYAPVKSLQSLGLKALKDISV